MHIPIIPHGCLMHVEFSYSFNPMLRVTLNGQLLRRWVFVAGVNRGGHERYEKRCIFRIDGGVPDIRNFSSEASGPRWDTPESSTTAQLVRIVNPTAKRPKRPKSPDKPKAKVIMCLLQV